MNDFLDVLNDKKVYKIIYEIPINLNYKRFGLGIPSDDNYHRQISFHSDIFVEGIKDLIVNELAFNVYIYFIDSFSNETTRKFIFRDNEILEFFTFYNPFNLSKEDIERIKYYNLMGNI